MSENKGVAVAAVLAAVFGAAGVIGAGYYGFGELRASLTASHAETRSVIVDLQTETIEEIRKLGDGGVASDESGGAITTSLDALAVELKAVRSEQQSIVERLGTLSAPEPAEQVTVTVPSDRIVRKIYFPLAVSKGDGIDKQIDAAIPDLRMFMAEKSCQTTVSGYSDTIGNDSANLNISRERAKYVAGKLREHDLDVADVEGWGERRLEVHTGDGVKHDQNRRVEISVSCTEGDMVSGTTETS